jgi:hypothetical protein
MCGTIFLRDSFDGGTDTLPKLMLEPAKEGFRAGQVPPLDLYLKEYYQHQRDYQGFGLGRALCEPSRGDLRRDELMIRIKAMCF